MLEGVSVNFMASLGSMTVKQSETQGVMVAETSGRDLSEGNSKYSEVIWKCETLFKGDWLYSINANP